MVMLYRTTVWGNALQHRSEEAGQNRPDTMNSQWMCQPKQHDLVYLPMAATAHQEHICSRIHQGIQLRKASGLVSR
jgi:hypothetical protein